MMNKQPFLHVFCTAMGKYLYDVNTNQIIRIDEDTYQYLKQVEQGEVLFQKGKSEQIKLLEGKGYLSSFRPSNMRHSHSDILQYHLDKNIEQVTLQLTQACNFRCAYCAYATPDFSTQRNHSPKYMKKEIVQRVIDFFVEHSVNQSKVSLGFYGGEPLLAQELLYYGVEYAEKAFEGKEVLFTITTNGSMFNRGNMDFLSKHNFSVVISLDGTQEMQDRSRKFAADGSGTFSTVLSNIKLIRQEYPELYKKISINSVVDPRYGCQGMHDLFSSDDLFSGINVRATVIDDSFSVEKVFQSDQYLIENGVNTFKVIMSLLGRYPLERVSKVAVSDLQGSREKLESELQSQNRLPETTSHSGPCLPGQRRLFVDVDGGFYPCERVSETSNAMRIGDIDHGFNYEQAKRILNIVELTANECRNCWALQHCYLCARYCDNNGALSADFKKSHCEQVRASINQKFGEYTMLQSLINRYSVEEE